MSLRNKMLLMAALGLASADQATAAEVAYKAGSKSGGYVIISGDIEEGDAAKFKSLVATQDVDMVFLMSEGGVLPEALEIGRAINISGHKTAVLDNYICASSCALIWLAGSTRIAGPKAHIGFHASYIMEGKKPIPSGIANAMIGRYLTQLGLPASAVIFATAASPEEMLWVNTAKPGGEGIAYEVYRPAAPNSVGAETRPTSTQRSSPAASATVTEAASLDGKKFGRWATIANDRLVGARTTSTNDKAQLGYLCLEGKTCRYALQLDLGCQAGDQYRISYQVEGYDSKPSHVTCGMDGKIMYLNGADAFARDIANEIAVTVQVDDTDRQSSSYRFNLIGYPQAFSALMQAGLITTPSK